MLEDSAYGKKPASGVAVRVHVSSRRVMMTGETGAYTYMSPEVLGCSPPGLPLEADSKSLNNNAQVSW